MGIINDYDKLDRLSILVRLKNLERELREINEHEQGYHERDKNFAETMIKEILGE